MIIDPYSYPASPQKAPTPRPPDFVLEPERQVDCPCDVAFQRPVLRDPTGWNYRCTACLHCGTVSLVEALVNEPRPHDVQCVGNRLLSVAPNVLAWLSFWPRLAWTVWQQDPAIYIPASFRCQTVAELKACEEQLLEEQRHLSVRERLLSLGIPPGPAPAGLPGQFQSFAQTFQGLHLTADTDIKILHTHARERDWAMPFAFPILRQRPHFTEEVAALLTSRDPEKRKTGISLVQYGRLNDPQIVAAVIALLQETSFEGEGRSLLETLLSTLYSIGPAAAAARPRLIQIALNIGNSDYYLRKRVEQIHDLIKPP